MTNPTALELVDTLCDNASKGWCDLIHALHETAHAEGVVEGFANGHAELAEFKTVLAKARAEGAEEMKVKIKDAGWPLYPTPSCDEWVVPLHKLAPKEADND